MFMFLKINICFKMTSIRSCASELKSITNELKRLNAQKRKLMTKKKQVEAVIISFLEEKSTTGS